MKKTITWLLCLASLSAIAQPPTRQESDLDESGSELFDQKKMGKVEVVSKAAPTVDKSTLPPKLARLQSGWVAFVNDKIDHFNIKPGATIQDKSLRVSIVSNPDARKKKAKKQKKPASFNPKKDHIDWFVAEQYASCLQIEVINKRGKRCNMNDFRLEPVSANLVAKTLPNGKQIIALVGTPEDYVCGRYDKAAKMKLTHIPSGMSTYISASVDFYSNLSARGLDMVYVAQKIKGANGNWCRVTDLSNASSWVLPYPLKIDGSGRNGKNGYSGYNGINGMNEYTWTDKNGNKHHNRGTCGSAGGNGGNGEDGQNGGNILVYADSGLPSGSISIDVAGGKGGAGGSGGLGGAHGAGSGCYGRAASGVAGRAGSNGSYGSSKVLYIPESICAKLFEDNQLTRDEYFFTIQ